MIIHSIDIKNLCSKIAPALDVNSYSVLTEVLQLKVENNILTISVTNKEYFVKVKFPVSDEEDFKATVKADLFIKLIDHITTESISFDISGNNLIIKGNGTYKLPLIYDNDKLLELPEINISNITTKFSITSDTLRSINTYNSKELVKGTILKPVQSMYYVDDEGAITFTSGACVNSFKLDQKVSLLFNNKLVKLFNLFDPETGVNFELGYDAVTKSLTQTKVKFYNDVITITAILNSDDNMVKSVPVTAIRNRVNTTYPYSVTFNKNYLLQAIDRLSLFITDIKVSPYLMFKVHNDYAVLSDVNEENIENVAFMNKDSGVKDEYTMVLDLNDFRLTLVNYVGQDVVISFGDKQAVLVPNGNVKIIVPEIMRS